MDGNEYGNGFVVIKQVVYFLIFAIPVNWIITCHTYKFIHQFDLEETKTLQ